MRTLWQKSRIRSRCARGSSGVRRVLQRACRRFLSVPGLCFSLTYGKPVCHLEQDYLGTKHPWSHVVRVGSVTVIGPATIDRIEQSGSTTVMMGGVVVYSGITFRNHGLITRVVTNVATQDEWLLNILRQHQVEVFNGITPATTMFVNHVEGDDRWQEMPISAAPIAVRQVERALKGIHHVHLGPLHPADTEPGVLRLLSRSSATVSLDVQGYVSVLDATIDKMLGKRHESTES